MRTAWCVSWFAAIGLMSVAGTTGCIPGRIWHRVILPEQRQLDLTDPPQLPKAHIPELPAPATVIDPQPDLPTQQLSLDEAIRVTLANTKVVRVLAGFSAVSSGRSIYDAAIANTVIDQEQARFDPRLEFNNTFDQFHQPAGVLDPLDPNGARIGGGRNDGYHMRLGLDKTNVLGGTTSLNFAKDRAATDLPLSALNPENSHSLTLSHTQPLLQGGGFGPNMAPIVIARLDTQRSYFQFKDSVQESVRGVIDAYWSLVAARTDEWARRQQVQQGQAALDRAEARRKVGINNAGEAAQTRLALANFRAALIAAEANVLQREAALSNIMGLPPTGRPRLIPVTPPVTNAVQPNWSELLRLAEERRPDVIELKLIIEADQQRLLQAKNQALPRVDATTFYRWNGLEGTTPSGNDISTNGLFGDWSVGVNFAVPLGLRQGRAFVRQQELLIARDWANLDQGLHAAIHELATSTRNLAQLYARYEANRDARQAARVNLEQQVADFGAGRAIFLNVLQAITDWGNAVSAEAQTLTQFNTELAGLERQTGTILETHGIFFFEERMAAIGPLTRIARPQCYPASHPPSANAPKYPVGTEAAENSFDLKSPMKRESQSK